MSCHCALRGLSSSGGNQVPQISYLASLFPGLFFLVCFSGVRQIPVQEFLCNKIPVYHFPVGIFASVVFSGVTFPVGVDFRCKVPVKEKCQ